MATVELRRAIRVRASARHGRRAQAAVATFAAAVALACSPAAAPPPRAAPDAAASEDATPTPTPSAVQPRVDPHSFARPAQARVQHLGLDLVVDVGAQQLRGRATAWVVRDRAHPDAPLRLDTRELAITAVEVAALPGLASAGSDVPRLADAEAAWSPAAFELGPVDPVLGAALTIQLPPTANLVRVTYSAAPEASGLQWLTGAQTASGRPFLYSQSQAIHARSWIPCQDTPGVRHAYDARVRLEGAGSAGLVARMAADDDGGPGRFVAREPIPAYLIALAVGELQRQELGPRTAVWAEPATLQRAAQEFADVERMIEATERRFGPYRWGRYDVLVLPPAFPYGGMENPRLTFATPTILAGDRSLVALIAHELAHSWSGNLVTSRDWEHFWLNEGFTTYLERRIVEEVFGPERAELEATIGLGELRAGLAELDGRPRDQWLVAALAGRDPDEVPAAIVYEKGALLLRTLERRFGRERFDVFLRGWFDAHAFTSVDTDMFVAAVATELAAPQGLDARELLSPWIAGPGIPADAAVPTSPALDAVDAALTTWLAAPSDGAALARATGALPWARWGVWERVHALRSLAGRVDAPRLAALDRAFGLTQASNAEVLAAWLLLATRHAPASVDQRLEQFLIEVGRRKFVVPLYAALAAQGEAGRARAQAIYDRARAGYHPITRASVEPLLAATQPAASP